MTDQEEPAVPEMRLELVPVPVSDVDRARDFYLKAGFRQPPRHPGDRHHEGRPVHASRLLLRHRVRNRHGPDHGHAAGIVKGLHLVVKDIEEARAALLRRGLDLSEVQDIGVKYVWFSDPDGNLWALQEWPEGYTG